MPIIRYFAAAFIIVAGVAHAGPEKIGTRNTVVAKDVTASWDKFADYVFVRTDLTGMSVGTGASMMLQELKMRPSFRSPGDTIAAPDSIAFLFSASEIGLQLTRDLAHDVVFLVGEDRIVSHDVTYEGMPDRHGYLVTGSGDETAWVQLPRDQALRVLEADGVEGRISTRNFKINPFAHARFLHFATYVRSLSPAP